jgi:fructoselysine 6-kinase
VAVSPPDVAICLGDNCIDRYLAPVAREFLGGQALNVAGNLRALGVDVAYAGRVGDDELGARILDELADRGVDVSLVESGSGSTGVTEVVVRDGEREFVSEDYGVSAPYAPSAEAIRRAGAASLVYAAHLTEIEAVAGALPTGPLLGVDMSVARPAEPVPNRVDVLFVSRPRAGSADAVAEIRALARHGDRIVVATRGAAGAVALRADELHEADAVPTEVVDSLGAGDAFAAAFMHSLLHSDDLGLALERGSVAGAAACRHFGALGAATGRPVPGTG